MKESFEIDGWSKECVELDGWSEECVELERRKQGLGRRIVIKESERTARRGQGVRVRSAELKVKEELGKRPTDWAANQACDSIVPGEPLFASKPSAN